MSFGIDQIAYVPALRTRPAELKGYENLSENIKSKILPLFTLAPWRRQDDIQAAVNQITTRTPEDHPTLITLTREQQLLNEHCRELLDPRDHFGNWRQFTSELPESYIPTALLNRDATTRNVAKQAQALENHSGHIAVCAHLTDTDLSQTEAVMHAIDDISNLTVILDAGFIREAKKNEICRDLVNSINRLRTIDDSVRVAAISTSFPRSVAAYGESPNRGRIDILEHGVQKEMGGDEVAIYGDHSSVHAVAYQPAGGRYTPRIDLPTLDQWIFERRPNGEPNSYVDIANAIQQYDEWHSTPAAWGATEINATAAGAYDGRAGAQRWIAVRVNLHITIQATYWDEASDPIDGDDYPDDDDNLV